MRRPTTVKDTNENRAIHLMDDDDEYMARLRARMEAQDSSDEVSAGELSSDEGGGAGAELGLQARAPLASGSDRRRVGLVDALCAVGLHPIEQLEQLEQLSRRHRRVVLLLHAERAADPADRLLLHLVR